MRVLSYAGDMEAEFWLGVGTSLSDLAYRTALEESSLRVNWARDMSRVVA